MTAINGIEALAGRVTAVVRDAAARTGVDFSYLLAQARIESGLNPMARAATSSARGLYQFTNATWLETVRKHGADHGLGWAAEALKHGAADAGSATRATILALRDNAEAAALMAGEFARDNAAILERRLGRAVGGTELYLAHFLGAGGATKFLGALATTPAGAAAALLPGAAAANRSIFFERDGTPRSLSDVYQRFAAKLEASPQRVAPAPAPAAPETQPLPAGMASPAQLAQLLIAELGG